MKIKHLFAAYIVAWLCVILATPSPMYAANPTVTVAKTASLQTFRANIYSISFATRISLADTAFIFNENSNWFSIDGVGAHASDSLITMECYSSEATADSVRLAILYQVSSAAAPTVTAATYPSSQWVTAKVDSVTLNNKTPGSSPGISTFAKLRLAGQANKMRIIVHEISGTVKDANQTITLRLLIPKR